MNGDQNLCPKLLFVCGCDIKVAITVFMVTNFSCRLLSYEPSWPLPVSVAIGLQSGANFRTLSFKDTEKMMSPGTEGPS
jgi:hypothetical protein